KGFNSDIFVRGEKYHIQTEDWGNGNPFIVTRVYRSGAVIKTTKTPYQEIFSNYARTSQTSTVAMRSMGEVGLRMILQKAIEKQHDHIITEINRSLDGI
ncbi:MAG TPA: hypothetical protein PLJ21_09005, partial [Pseudobdellovibrionaceae bacterium]|nr:hypothetical protein [Pseudobdellovibrionaceae bacterium]